MKEKFIKFMEGRYGVDGFARFTMGVALVCIVASVFSVMEAPRERF